MITFTWKYGKEQILFEEIFDEHRYQNDISENSREQHSNENIDEDDFESESRLKQPSEYLFDIHLLKLMKNAVLENEYNITNKHIHLYYDVIQKFLAYNKGLLVKIDKITYSENKNIKLCEQIFHLIDTCRTIWQTGESFDVIRRESPELFEENNSYQGEILAIENYFQDRNHRDQPYYLYEKLVQNISPLMKERRQLVRMIKYISPYIHTLSPHGNKVLTCQMILQDDYYFEFIKQASELIVSDVTETINAYLALSSINEADFTNSMEHIINCINFCDRFGNYAFGRFRGKNKGCFCVFDIAAAEYISLSGPFDVTDSTIESYFGYDQNKKRSNKDLMDKINNIILADPTFQNSKYVNLSLLTRRYPYTNSPNIPSNGETVKDAIKRRIDKNEIQSDYSCCERKIFSRINAADLGQSYMFARHKPCQKCIPAIRRFLQVPGRQMKIFYYENDSIKEFDMSTI